jgi:hypothetical protein
VGSEGAEGNSTGAVDAADCPVWDRHFEVVDRYLDCLELRMSVVVIEFGRRGCPSKKLPHLPIGDLPLFNLPRLSQSRMNKKKCLKYPATLATYLKYHLYV